MRIQLLSSYFYLPSWNPLSHLIKWYYFDNNDGTYSLEVVSPLQQVLAKLIYKRVKISTKFISKLR